MSKEIREALEPFARAHNRRPFINDTHPDYDKEFADEQAGLTWGDLRNAAAILAALETKETEGEPVAWLYTNGDKRFFSVARLTTFGRQSLGWGWSKETPLYAALASPTAMQDGGRGKWTRVTERLPKYGEGLRVVIHTEGHDFAGEQFFHIDADTLTEVGFDDDVRPASKDSEVAACASHWIYDYDLTAALSLPDNHPLPENPQGSSAEDDSASIDVIGLLELAADQMAGAMYLNDYGEWVLPKEKGLNDLAEIAVKFALSQMPETPSVTQDMVIVPMDESEADFLNWIADELKELNPSNYDHDDVCDANNRAVNVILAIQARLSASPIKPGIKE